MESEETEGAVRRSTSGPFGKDKKQRGSAPGYVLPPISHSLGCSHLPGFILVSDPRCRAHVEHINNTTQKSLE